MPGPCRAASPASTRTAVDGRDRPPRRSRRSRACRRSPGRVTVAAITRGRVRVATANRLSAACSTSRSGMGMPKKSAGSSDSARCRRRRCRARDHRDRDGGLRAQPGNDLRHRDERSIDFVYPVCRRGRQGQRRRHAKIGHCQQILPYCDERSRATPHECPTGHPTQRVGLARVRQPAAARADRHAGHGRSAVSAGEVVHRSTVAATVARPRTIRRSGRRPPGGTGRRAAPERRGGVSVLAVARTGRPRPRPGRRIW